MVGFVQVFALLQATALALECHPQGPILPRPRNLTRSGSFQAALANLTRTLDAAVTGEIRAGWDIRNVSLSVGLVSLDQNDASTPAWEYHHLALGNVNGTKVLDRHSQYLTGSISKVVSDAVLLRSGVSIDDPITKYIPSLKNASSLISWDNITLRALASQLSGIPPNYGFSEYYYLREYFEYLGFPHLNDSSFAECGIIGLNGGCSQFLRGMHEVYPIAPPMSRPVYSNIAFTLLMYAVQSVTGKNYTQLVRDLIAVPFNMSSTSPSPGNDTLAVIPPVANSWGSNYADNAPGGGLVSTLSDLSSLLHAILDRTLLPTGAAGVREWLQPRSFAGSQYSFVGMPWEIYRPSPDLLFPGYSGTSGENGHSVTVAAKDGAAYGYRARIAVVDEYRVGLVVLTAGDPNAMTSVYDAVLSTLVPAIDRVAGEEAEAQYVGGFVGQSEGVRVNATMELDGTSLKLNSLYRNGTDMLLALREVWKVTLAMFLPSLENTGRFRLYPAEIEKMVELEGRKVVEEDWRMWWDVELEIDTDLPGKGLSGSDCLSWSFADWIYYGGEPMDRVVFVKDAGTGEVLGVDVPFLRTGFMGKLGRNEERMEAREL